MMAIANEHLQTSKELMYRGADPMFVVGNAIDDWETPLFRAARTSLTFIYCFIHGLEEQLAAITQTVE